MKKLSLFMFVFFLFSTFLIAPYSQVYAAQKYKIDINRLYAYPRLWGTEPQEHKWSPTGKQLAFRWNNGGMRFTDIWICDILSGDLKRLTDMKGLLPDELEIDKRTEEEKRDAKRFSSGINSFNWSPDGNEIVFSYIGDIFVVNITDNSEPKRLLHTASAESQVNYSPDGKYISFVRDGNIYLIDRNEYSLKQITQLNKPKCRIGQYFWSPDSKMMAFIRQDLKEVTEIVIPDYTKKFTEAKKFFRFYAGVSQPRYTVGIINIPDSKISWAQLVSDKIWLPMLTQNIKWAPDSEKFSFTAIGEDGKDWHLWIVKPNGEVKALVKDHDERWIPYAFITQKVDWLSDSQELLYSSYRDGYMHIYSISLDEKKSSQVTRGPWDIFELLATNDDKNIIYVSSEVKPYERTIFLNKISKKKPRIIGYKNGFVTSLSLSPEGKYVAYKYSNSTTPPEIYISSLEKNSSPKKVTKSPLPDFYKYNWIEPKYMEFKNNSDGAAIYGKLYLPELVPGKKHPAVISRIYASSAMNRWVWWYGPQFEHWLANEYGYVIMQVNLRNSPGIGRDFYTGYYQKMGLIDVDEMVSAAEYLKKLDYVDPEKLGVWGGSYGGFLTLMTLFKAPGVFKAGVATMPVTDWASYNMRYTTSRLGGPPQENEEVYKACSPIFHVDGLKDHLLIIHGMLDDNVLFQDTVRLTQKLVDAGKDFEVMIYPKDVHGFFRDETQVDFYRRIAEYFKKHLGLGPKK